MLLGSPLRHPMPWWYLAADTPVRVGLRHRVPGAARTTGWGRSLASVINCLIVGWVRLTGG